MVVYTLFHPWDMDMGGWDSCGYNFEHLTKPLAMLKRLIRNEKSSGNEKVKDQEAPENEEIKTNNEEEEQPDSSDPQPATLDSQPESSDLQPESGDLISNEILEAASSCSEGSADPQEAIEILRTIAGASPSRPVGIEMYDLVMRGLSYAADVAAAYSEGEVAGRNTRIDLLKLEAEKTGDGVPILGGKPQGLTRPSTIFDLAREAY